MKFLCDNCKAKYQIADEKVAGKTVRMKCRKCGHQIEVRATATVTETGASAAPPKPAPLAPFAASPPPGMTGMPSAVAPRPPVPARPLATSLSQAKPRAPSAPMATERGALAGAFQRNLSDAPDAVLPSDGGTAPIELSVTDEWYVAINGVPVGPVRISELRRKAAVGAVTEESLCWQEGLEEWRPIRSIPELAALVREAAQGGQRPSMISSPDLPPSARSPSLPVAPRTPVAPPPPTAPSFDATAAMAMPAGVLSSPPARPMTPFAPATGRNNVVPFRPAATTDRASDDFGLGALAVSAVSPGAAAPSLAPPQPMFAPAPASALAPPVTVPSPVADPFAVPPGPPASHDAPINAPPYRESYVPPVAAAQPLPPQAAPPPRSIPLWFWPVLLLALGFGGGLAFVVFKPQPVPPPVVIQQPAATATTPVSTAPVDKGDIPPPPPATTDQADTTPGTTTKSPKGSGTKVATTKPTAAPTEEKKGLDLGGLVPGAGGPNVGAAGGPGPGAGGGLDQAGVERVVAAHRAGVKRTCWERGGADQKSSVNVTISATVAANGTVATTSSSGDDPVVAKCIENQVKTWMFSAPGASQQIAIPFKFVRQ